MCADHIADTKLNHENSEQWEFFFLNENNKQQKNKEDDENLGKRCKTVINCGKLGERKMCGKT